ncbi:MAG: hemolysin secretion protein D [Rhodothalassiaceae bacterium]|nr:MAG: hemolysin secretion protein D [Rhodothalassiaceae bacterium]
MTDTLFRREALEHQRQRLTGEVTLAVPLGLRLLVLWITGIVALAVTFLALADYARKETVRGFLRPDRGLVTLRSPRVGRVEAIHVAEGETVAAGQPLISIVSETVVAGGPVETRLADNLKAEIAGQRRLLDGLDAKYAMRADALDREEEGLRQERAALARQLALQRELVRVARENWEAVKGLAARGVVAQPELKAREERWLSQRQQLAGLEQRLSQIEARLAQIAAERARLPVDEDEERAALTGRIAALERQLWELEGRRRLTLVAPVDGRVSAIQASPGQQVGNLPLITILPAGGGLEAELLIPARAAGFVEAGQKVRLAFDAFDYRRFGLGDGEIVAVSRTILRPDEIASPVAVSEPVYRARVRLARDHVEAYGRRWPLQPGMTLSADIILERRSLLGLLLDPLRALKGRV